MIIDGFMSKYPYTDFHTMNLDWLLAQMLQLRTDMKDFVILNTIKYADPIQWNITTQYQGNTVVVEPISGDAYLSTQPVPAGVAITDTEYWTIIGSFGSIFSDIKASIAAADEGPSTIASDNREPDDLVWLNDILNVVTAPIATGESYVGGVNCDPVTIETLLNKEKEDRTEADQVILSSIMGIGGQIDDINGSINNINGSIATMAGNIEELAEEIAQIRPTSFVKPEDFGAVGDGVTDDSVAFQAAIDSKKPVLLTAKYAIHNIDVDIDTLILGSGGVIYTMPLDGSTPSKNVFNVTGDNVDIINVKFIGHSNTGDTSPTNKESLIDANGGSSLTIKGCHFEGLGWSYSNIDTAIWDFFALVLKAVDVTKVTFEGNTLESLGGDELFIVTPHNKTYCDIEFNSNVFNNITGASISLLATNVSVQNNTVNNYTYGGSFLNYSTLNGIVKGNVFNGCTFGSCFDSYEGGVYVAENVIISDNIYTGGSLSGFILSSSKNIKVLNNVVEAQSLIIWNIEAQDPQYYAFNPPAFLSNTTKRTLVSCLISGNRFNCTSTSDNNTVMRLGAILGVVPHPMYTKAQLGYMESVIVDNNTFNLKYRTTGGDYLIRIETGARLFSVTNNVFDGVCRDSYSEQDKFIVSQSGSEDAAGGNLFNMENNSFSNVQDGTRYIYILRCDYTAQTRFRTQQYNGNYTSAGSMNAVTAISDNIVKYTIS